MNNNAPWLQPQLLDWSIVGMNHYHMNGERRLFVAMTNKYGICIQEEGVDNEDLWNRLRSKALTNEKMCPIVHDEEFKEIPWRLLNEEYAWTYYGRSLKSIVDNRGGLWITEAYANIQQLPYDDIRLKYGNNSFILIYDARKFIRELIADENKRVRE